MYDAKAAAARVPVYEPGRATPRNGQPGGSTRQAIKHDLLALHYQRIVELASGR